MLSVVLIVFCICLLVATWGFHSVQVELAKRQPRLSINSLKSRFNVDPFIWSSDAPRELRRRYILCSACVPLGMLCLVYLAVHDPFHPERHLVGGLVASLGTALTSLSLVVKVVRHGVGQRQ
jgi:hypothetical protein